MTLKKGDKTPPNLTRRISLLEKQIKQIRADIRVIAVTNDKLLGEQLERLGEMVKEIKKL